MFDRGDVGGEAEEGVDGVVVGEGWKAALRDLEPDRVVGGFVAHKREKGGAAVGVGEGVLGHERAAQEFPRSSGAGDEVRQHRVLAPKSG